MVFRNFGTEHSDVRTCIDGVNEQVAAATRNQCTDARNVWERGGRLVQRPGSSGIARLGVYQTSDYVSPPGPITVASGEPLLPAEFPSGVVRPFVIVSEFAPGVFVTAPKAGPNPSVATLTLDNLTVGNRWYIGSSVPFSAIAWGTLAYATVPAATTTATLEYWNGTAWVAMSYREYTRWYNGTSGPPYTFNFEQTPHHWGYTQGPDHNNSAFDIRFITARTQSDWSTTQVGGVYNYYWWRFTIGTADLHITNAAHPGATENYDGSWGASQSLAVKEITPQVLGTPFFTKANFPTSSRWIGVMPWLSRGGSTYISAETLDNTRWMEWTKGWGDISRQASSAVNTQGGKVYLAYNNHVTVHRALPAATDDIEARVETADWAIGSGAPYDQNSIALLKAFPAASLIAWFQNRLWFGAIDGEPNAIRWSAAAPYNEVIPQLAVEYIDQPPTAMKPLGENMVIYTQDNIYLSVLDSVDDFAVPHFKLIKVVAGRGCAAQNSVVEINGRHIFLSEDGLYAFDGTSAIKKITLQQVANGEIDRLQDTFASVSASSRAQAAAVHWRRERVVLFSVPINGSTTNNITVVWDYERDKFWLWDGLQAQFWINDNGVGYDETIYFGTAAGVIYRLDAMLPSDDGVAIQTYIVTSPIGMRDSMHKGMTETKVLAGNHVGQLSVQSWPDGMATKAKTGILKYDDYNEAKWGTAKWGTDKWSDTNIRFRHTHFKTDGSYFQVKVIGPNALGKRFDMVQLAAFYVDKYEDTR